MYGLSDIFCPNESETELLTGQPVSMLAECEAAARVLLGRGAGTVVLTLGERGSLLVSPHETVHAPGVAVVPVDSTGAGDAFVGSRAYFLIGGKPLVDALRRANHSAASGRNQTAGRRSTLKNAEIIKKTACVACVYLRSWYSREPRKCWRVILYRGPQRAGVGHPNQLPGRRRPAAGAAGLIASGS